MTSGSVAFAMAPSHIHPSWRRAFAHQVLPRPHKRPLPHQLSLQGPHRHRPRATPRLAATPPPRQRPTRLVPILHQLKPQLAADESGRTLQAFDRYIALRLEDAIDLRAAGVHQLGELRLGDALTFHFLAQLPGDNARNSLGLGRLANALFREK